MKESLSDTFDRLHRRRKKNPEQWAAILYVFTDYICRRLRISSADREDLRQGLVTDLWILSQTKKPQKPFQFYFTLARRGVSDWLARQNQTIKRESQISQHLQNEYVKKQNQETQHDTYV